MPLIHRPPRLAAAQLQRREDWLTVLTLLLVIALGLALLVWVPAG